MKRDMNIVRAILSRCREDDVTFGSPVAYSSNDVSIFYHAKMLADEELVYFENQYPNKIMGNIRLYGLTWEGHDLLEELEGTPIISFVE